jgi:hypothetical protein
MNTIDIEVRKANFDNAYDNEGICVMEQYDLDLYANLDKRYLLVEKNMNNNETWLTTHDTVASACEESANAVLDTTWRPWLLVDLDTGDSRELWIIVAPTKEF